MAAIIKDVINSRPKHNRKYRRFSSINSEEINSIDELDNRLEVNSNLLKDEMRGRRRAVSSIEIDYTSYEKEREQRVESPVGESGVRFAGDVHCVASDDNLGSLNLLSQKYESLDYDLCENMLYLSEQKQSSYSKVYYTEILRWTVIFLIGLLTAFTACIIVISVEVLSSYKYETLRTFVDSCSQNNHKYCIIIPYALWLLFNGIPVALGSALVTYLAPIAAGSGIPVIKCYLNGIKVPEVVRIKTYFAKLFGVILSVVGGLACGKEGPMIHCGAVIAAGISQGKSTTFNKDSKYLQEFREDREKRDFVSAGN
jgi:chloride channel 7